MQILPPIYWMLIISVSVIVGYYFTFLLATQKTGNRKSNLLLAGFIFVIAYFLTVRIINLSGFYREFPYLIGTAPPVWYLAGPIFYFYLKSHLFSGFKFKKSDLLHCLPFMFSFFNYFSIIFLSGSDKIFLMENPQSSPAVLFPVSFLPFIVLIGYFSLSFMLVVKSLDSYKAFFSNTKKIVHLQWIKRLLLIYIFYLLFDFAAALSSRYFGVPYFQLNYITMFVMSLFIHFSAYYSFKYQGNLFNYRSGEAKKYLSSSLSEEEIDSYFAFLNKVMTEEKVYLNNNLSLTELAEKINIKPYMLSQVINQKFKSNFYDYVNSFRVEEAKRRLANPEYSHISVLGIGLDAGFNNKTSFNSSFKKIENVTPSAFRKKHSN